MEMMSYIQGLQEKFCKAKQDCFGAPGTDMQDLWEGGSAGTSVRGPESQERARESLKGPFVLAIDILFLFFHIFWVFYTIFSLLRYRLGLSIYNNATHTDIWEDRHFNHKPKTLAWPHHFKFWPTNIIKPWHFILIQAKKMSGYVFVLIVIYH
jgi:hypothetical protein